MNTRNLTLVALLFLVGSCTPPIRASELTPPASPELATVTQPPYTPTPDANLFTISAVIDGEPSQEEIATTLYTEWLDHFVNKDFDPKMRLDEYVINEINIPSDQRCAKELGGIFVVGAEVTATTALPIISTTGEETSDWFVAGGGNIIDSHQMLRYFSGVIYRSGKDYTLVVITQIPMCD